jgi:hypothetical protein
MQCNILAYINSLENTYNIKRRWITNSFKIALSLVSVSGVITGGMLPVKPQTLNSLSLQSGDVVTASVDLTRPGRTIPWSFSGFSFEHGDFLRFTGTTPIAINPTFVKLLKNVGNNNNGPVMLRFGGNSTDASWWNPNGLTKPPGITCDITNTDLSIISSVINQTKSKVIFGLNSGQNKPSLAVELAQATLSNLPPGKVYSFEIGNEPDLYAKHGYYTDSTTGATVNLRPSTYSFNDYLSEFSNYATTLKNSFSTLPPLSGPVFTSYQWMQYLPTFLDKQTAMVNAITYHRYPLNACGVDPGSANYPTIFQLLSDKSSYNLAQGVEPFVKQASSYGRKLWLSEINSVACGGASGVSNTFASALWGIDVMFNMAAVGVRGMQFHTTSGGFYSPFKFIKSTNSSKHSVYTPVVYPLYYGMLLFAQATANSSRLLPVSVQSAGNVKVWATIDNQNVVRVLVINKDLSASGNAKIQLSSQHSSASLVRLTASRASATTGITLAGQTFDGTIDGNPVGTYANSVVTPSNGIYTFSLPAASAALLTVNPVVQLVS